MTYIKEVELKFKKRPAKGFEAWKVCSSEVAYTILRDAQNEVVEKMWALHLDGQNKVNCLQVVGIGTLTACTPYLQEIVRVALLTGSPGVVVAHNHPSGDTRPSLEDKTFTNELSQACKLMGIKLLDHIIIGEEGYLSFADGGLL